MANGVLCLSKKQASIGSNIAPIIYILPYPSSGGEKGRSAFIHNRGIHSLCEVITKQTFQFEDATDLLLSLLGMSGHLCWTYHRYLHILYNKCFFTIFLHCIGNLELKIV